MEGNGEEKGRWWVFDFLAKGLISALARNRTNEEKN
jgi:hypothetical protein